MLRAYTLIFVLMASGITFAKEATEPFMTKPMGNFTAPTPASEYDVQLLKEIEELGWHNVHISAESGSPEYAFTIGHFQKQSHPELILIGLPAQTAHELLNIAAIKIAGAKEKIEPYREYTDFTEGLSVVFVPVGIEHYEEYFGYANWYYSSMPNPYPAMQMVWPDREGRFPWEPGYDNCFLKLQPLLSVTP